jgi:hypothetical protein
MLDDPGRTTYADALQPSASDAVRFLAALDAAGRFTFQTFDDSARGDESLKRITHGNLIARWTELVWLNNSGAGIFVTVNATDLKGRKTENITRVRALFVDLDGAPLDPVATCSTPPHIIVESSPGRWHCYWLVCDVPLEAFKPMQKALAARFNGDPAVCDLPRVMRLPGFLHRKGEPFQSILQDHDEARPPYTFAQMRAAFPPAHEPESEGANNTCTPGADTERHRGAAWAREALAASANELASAGEGTRHKTLLAKAVRMGTMVARGWIDTSEVRRALFAAAESNGQGKQYGPGNIGATIKDGIKHGILTPHPDLPDDGPAPGNKAAKPSGKQAPAAAPQNVKELATMTFAPIKYVVPGVILEGLTLLAGKPKVGKSWLALHAALAVAEGGFTLGELHCIEGDVLYCALEDNLRRLKSRICKLRGEPPWNVKRLDFYTELPRLADGGLAWLETWIQSKPHPRLIVIDVLNMVRPVEKKREQTNYEADYEAVLELRKLAAKYSIAIVAVAHLRKAESDDAFDTVSGTLGLTGAVDSILVLRRDTSGAFILHGRGRDLVELEKALVFNKEACTWRIAGEAAEVQKSNQRATILQALGEVSEPIGPRDIAAATGMKEVNVRRMLGRMLADGVIAKVGYGKYQPRSAAVGVVSATAIGAYHTPT